MKFVKLINFIVIVLFTIFGINEAFAENIPSCEEAANLAGYTEWTLYQDHIGVGVAFWSNRSIITCDDLNKYDSAWLWGKQGDGWNGHRDWIEFGYFNPNTQQTHTNNYIDEVINIENNDGYYAVCCVRGERSR